MPKGIVNNVLSNNIEWATHNGKGLITGKRENVTEQVIKATFQHMKTEHDRMEEKKEYFAYKIDGFGELRFYPDEK